MLTTTPWNHYYGAGSAGKTTHTGKIANMYKHKGKNPLLVACDVYRPAAIDQLKIVGESIGVPVFSMGAKISPVEIARAGIEHARKNGNDMVFIDTAGMRKRGKITDNIERYSTMRSLTAIDRCDVVVMMVDAVEGVTEQDTKIAGYAHDQGKACVIAINKWDLVEKDTGTLEKYRTNVYESFNFMMYAPVVFISAKSGQRVNKLLENIKFAADQAALRVSTGMLNDVLNEAVAIVPPPSDKGRRLKIFYMTQIKVKPPTFVIFCNSVKLFHYSYLRYIENQIRKNFGFEGTPIVFKIHEKNDETMKTKK